MPRSGRKRPLTRAAVLFLVAGCAGALPSESGPRAPTAAAALSADEATAPSCDARGPGERVELLRRGVAQLPPAAGLAARTRLAPQLGVVSQALARGQAEQAAGALRAFIAEIVELRLRAPYEERVVLAAEAHCLLDELDPPAASGV